MIPVAWKIATLTKEKGRLGINPVESTNFALLKKWLWRYHNEPQTLWRKFIYAKYEKTFKGDLPTHSRFSTANAPWKAITNSCQWFNENMSWKIQNGESLSFWNQNWNECCTLKTRFPRLYALSRTKEGSIKEMWNESTMD
ncbi:LINE-1 retrotransposable element ORF2 protein [Cucumis melo var. makuwa]|uniref:LINE-1 retrotransposable element ORF2 protein n=1 Tax=Cucumis melo var. makuwa TaxID=1194695 RepID=A0A5D3DJG7_CUCMM|nr:LINE-1 retrotransposable element ORF2 protein [Cucumis melo var. makuwa]TYK23735.1 LINE-1 retrotransposable element ORF2 protein [Cucumis melo var. makuwa]